MPGVRGLNAEREREVGFARAGRAQEHNVARFTEIAVACEMSDGVTLHGGLMVEDKILKCLPRRESSCPDKKVRARGVTSGHFPV